MAHTPRISIGCALEVARDVAQVDPTIATGFEAVSGFVQMQSSLTAPERQTTEQTATANHAFLTSLNEDSSTFEFNCDLGQAAGEGAVHSELLADYRAGKKYVWQVDRAPGGTGAPRRRRQAIISGLTIANILGDVIRITLELTWCKAPHDTTVDN